MERAGIGERFTYLLVESEPKEEMFQKVNIVDSQVFFLILSKNSHNLLEL